MKAITLKKAEKQNGLYHVVKNINGGGYLYRLLAKENDIQGMLLAYKKIADEKLMAMLMVANIA